MTRSNKGTRTKGPAPTMTVSDSVCYCNGQRDLSVLEVFCTGCSKWYHANCLQDLKEFYGVCFMVCYVFTCKDCSPTKTESWVPKQASFSHMAITVLANLTAEALKAEGRLNLTAGEGEPVYFGLYDKILPYFDNNWENLTSMPRRAKNTWHQTLQKALAKETNLFRAKPGDENSFCLVEPLVDIGPANEAVKQIGKKSTSEKTKDNLSSTLVNSSPVDRSSVDVDDGPKTRGASKRRNADTGGNTSKKPKLAADYSVAKFAGLDNPVDIPFNKEGYRYFLVERDPNVSEKAWGEEDESMARAIPSHMYRLVTTNTITLSPNDRAYQLRITDDQLTVTGFEGYCVARATHSVSKGTWYYEVNFLKQPDNSHIRIGWSRGQAPVQACVGYNKFSYAFRSHKGTKFHDAQGKTYFPEGFKEGDVIGVLISVPHDIVTPSCSSKDYLPPARKECHLINFKHNYFYEAQDDFSAALKNLKEVPGSKVEFFVNGKSCGTAFEDIYRGFYYPAISIFGPATIRVNFGPSVKHLPKGARSMSERPQEVHYEQTLSDLLHLVEHDQLYE